MCEGGHDGMIVNNIVEGGYAGELRYGGEPKPSTDYIPMNPNQIKSATGNEGTFSVEKGDIRFRTSAAEHNQTKVRQHVDHPVCPPIEYCSYNRSIS